MSESSNKKKGLIGLALVGVGAISYVAFNKYKKSRIQSQQKERFLVALKYVQKLQSEIFMKLFGQQQNQAMVQEQIYLLKFYLNIALKRYGLEEVEFEQQRKQYSEDEEVKKILQKMQDDIQQVKTGSNKVFAEIYQELPLESYTPELVLYIKQQIAIAQTKSIQLYHQKFEDQTGNQQQLQQGAITNSYYCEEVEIIFKKYKLDNLVYYPSIYLDIYLWSRKKEESVEQLRQITAQCYQKLLVNKNVDLNLDLILQGFRKEYEIGKAIHNFQMPEDLTKDKLILILTEISQLKCKFIQEVYCQAKKTRDDVKIEKQLIESYDKKKFMSEKNQMIKNHGITETFEGDVGEYINLAGRYLQKKDESFKKQITDLTIKVIQFVGQLEKNENWKNQNFADEFFQKKEQ